MRYLFVTLALLFFAACSYGQRFHGGPMTGLVVSQLDGDGLGGYNKPGIRAGGWVNTDISEMTTLQLELQYIQKGSKISEKELKSGEYYHSRLNYLQLSFLGKYELMPKLKGEAGIAGGYLFNPLEDTDGAGFIEPLEPFNNYELSLIIGLSYRLSDYFIGNIRLNYSALPIREHPGGQVYYINRGQYNNALSFSLYYQID
jgi:hypothetical protein